MAAISSTVVPSRRWPRLLLAAGVLIPAGLALASWYFTEPLDDIPAPAPASVSPAAESASTSPSGPSWPEGRLDGAEAKARLLAIIADASRRIDRFEGYTATFRKQERIGGMLLPEQTLAMKVRQRPLAIYFKFLAPKAGKEVVYAEGHHGNKVIAHNGDWTRRLVPRLALDPHGPAALAENRHPITEAGLANLARKLLAFRKLDLEDAAASTVLDRVDGPDGKPWPRSVHVHTHKSPARPFARVEVLYDPETLLPLRISSYDWPVDGQTGELLLAERYTYQELDVDAPLTAIDFDPANPRYEFQRF